MIDKEMSLFAQENMELEFMQFEQSLNRSENTYHTSHRKPVASPFLTPVFDFSAEALA